MIGMQYIITLPGDYDMKTGLNLQKAIESIRFFIFQKEGIIEILRQSKPFHLGFKIPD